MIDNEFLLAISNMMDKKLDSRLKPIEDSIQAVKDEVEIVKNELYNVKLFQENVILPRLNTIESCYTSTYDRYKKYADRMEANFDDTELLKKVVTEHSEKLQKIS